MVYKYLYFSLLFVISLPLSHVCGATGNIDSTTKYQQIEGFGASGAWNENRLTNHPLKSQLYDILFGQLGLDIYRVRNVYNQSGYAQYMSRTGEIVTEGEDSLGRPLKILISSWTPPTSLKSNGNLVGGTLIKDSNGNYMYDAFAQWWADSLDAFSSYGIDANYISMQNDPNIIADWDSCRFAPTEDSNLAGYDIAFETLWQKLNTEMGSAMPKMLAPETTKISIADRYIDNLIDDAHAYGYAHHLQDANIALPDDVIPIMEDFELYYGDKPRIQTEFAKLEPDTITYADAMGMAILIHNSMTVEQVSAFLYWELFWSSPKGLVSLPASGSSYTINPVYYSFKQYSAFIDSGWQRIDATTSDDPNLRISAYINPDQNEISAVIINTTAGTSIDLTLSFTGFTVGSGEVYRTSSTQNCALLGSFTNPITLPANSITTLALSITGPQKTLSVSSTSGGSVVVPGEGDFNYAQDSNAAIVAEAEQFYHFVNWTGSAADADKVADVNAASTTVFMDANYTVVANFEADPPDVTPPTPDPMTWFSLPTATGLYSITMTATTATDDSTPVEYFFECTNDGSKSSDWQTGTTYIADDLDPLTTYTFRVKARDSYLTPNETGWSSSEYATTEAPPTDIEILGSWVSGTTHAKEPGTNRVLIFIAHAESTGSMNLSSVTYGDQAMTKVMEYNYFAASGYAYAAAYILKEAGIDAATSPPGTFIPTWDVNEPTSPAAYTSVFLSNVDQTTSIGATSSGGSTSNPVTTGSSLATNDGDMVILGATCGNAGSYTLNNGFTEGTDQQMGYGTITGVTGHKSATGASETPSATYSSTINRQMIIGFVLKAVVIDYPPTAPTGLSATAGNEKVLLDWNDNGEPDVNGYNVYRSETSGSGYGKVNVDLVSDSNYIDNAVTNDIPYFYVVTAVDNDDHESGYSNEATATPAYQNCEDVLAGGYGFESDLTGDCYVNYWDVEIIADYWLRTDCTGPDNCQGADFEPADGTVDFYDYSDFAMQWLMCNNPADADCTPNW